MGGNVVTYGRLVVGLVALNVLVAGCSGLDYALLAQSAYSFGPRASSTWLDALILDPIGGRKVGYVSVRVQKTAPTVIFEAKAETQACKLLGTVVTKFLEGDELPDQPEVYVNRLAATAIESGDAVTAVLEEFSGEFSSSKEDKVFSCITEAIREEHPTVRIVPSDGFRHTAFPDLTPEEVSSELLDIALLVEQPEFQERIAPLGIRYLILVVGGGTMD